MEKIDILGYIIAIIIVIYLIIRYSKKLKKPE